VYGYGESNSKVHSIEDRLATTAVIRPDLTKNPLTTFSMSPSVRD
jgi:hypothetical protein